MLDEMDIDRIGDKTKIVVLEALKQHEEKDHGHMAHRITKLERAHWYDRGIFAGALGLLSFWKHG